MCAHTVAALAPAWQRAVTAGLRLVAVPVAIASTRGGELVLVHGVNSTDAKGQETNRAALELTPATYGPPSE